MAEQLMEKVIIFHCLPMLGFALSNLLGRHKQKEPRAVSQVQQLRTTFAVRRALDQAARSAAERLENETEGTDAEVDSEATEDADEQPGSIQVRVQGQNNFGGLPTSVEVECSRLPRPGFWGFSATAVIRHVAKNDLFSHQPSSLQYG